MSSAPNLDSDHSTTCKTDTHHVNISSKFHLSRKGCKVRFPARKARRNMIPENNKSTHLDQSKSCFSSSNSSKENGGFVFGASDSCNRMGSFVFGAKKSSSELNFGMGNARVPFEVENNRAKLDSESKCEKFVFGAGTGGLLSGSSTGNVSFVFGAKNCSTTMQSSSTVFPNDPTGVSSGLFNGDAGFLFRANHGSSTIQSSSTTASHDAGKAGLSNGNGSFVFSADINSSTKQSSSTNASHDAGKSGLSNGNAGFVFSANSNSSSTQSSSPDGNLHGVSDADAFPRASRFMSSSGVSCCASTTNEGNGEKVSVFNAKSSSSTVKSSSTNLNDATDASATAKVPMFRSSLGDSSSQVGQMGYKGPLGQSRKADDFAFVFTAKNGDLASGLKFGNETNVGAAVDSQMDAGNGSLFGSDSTQGDKGDDFSFVSGDKKKASMSSTGLERTRSNNIGGTTEFVSKGESSSDFGFGGNAKDNFSSPADWKNHLNGETTRINNKKLPSEPIRSDFKFVNGSGSVSGSAFYKVPLSKLVDEMKGLKIDDYSHNLKNVGKSFHFHTSGVNTTQNGGSASCFSTKSVGNTSKNEHKDPHAHSTGGSQAQKDGIASNTASSGFEDILLAGTSVEGEVKTSKPCAMNNTASTFWVGVSDGVNLSCPSKGEIREDNQPLNSGITGPAQQKSWGCEEFPTVEVENKENFSFTTAPSDLKSSSDLNKSSSNKSKPLAELLEFVLSDETSKEKKLKKTGRKLRFRTRPKNMTQPKNMPTDNHASKYFESPGHSSPMNFSPYQEKTDIAADSASASVAVESKEEDFSAGTERSATTSDGQSVGQDSVNAMDHRGNSFKSDSSLPDIDPSSKTRRHYSRKYKLKVGDASKGKTTINTSHNVKSQVQSEVVRNTDSQADGGGNYQDPTDGWRIRGNQAYKAGDLSLAEDLYTKGILSAVDKCDPSGMVEPLLLCYGNRAAARMALGRMREALDDCRSAAALDPSFTKVQLRAAHCHLVLGDFEAAMQCYENCLESANHVCLDRRLAIDAADSLRKAQKVGEYMCQATELLKQKTSDAANSSLSLITQALSISCYSEKLLEMKGEALFLLRKYKEVIELCEQTLKTAEKNFTGDERRDSLNSAEWKSSPRLWRWHLMAKSYFHWGRLEVALDLLEKCEQLLKSVNSYGSMNEESPASLAVTIRDLLHRKKAGNEAFKQGKHMDAVEHYTGAISIGVESRPFVAVCFCNRAAAHQALGQIVDAIADCNLAIALDENYFKAVSRRATLYEMIRDYKYACIDIEKLVALLEKKSPEKVQLSGRQGESTGDKDLKQARRRLSLIEDKTRKELPLDLYLILGIKASDTEPEIKKAYRKAALKHHPDKAGQFLARNENGDEGGRLWKDIGKKVHDDADKLFKMIGEAYGTLSDPDKRSKYNYEEEIRKTCHRESTSSDSRNTNSGRSPNFNGYPRRQSDFYSDYYERRRDARNW